MEIPQGIEKTVWLIAVGLPLNVNALTCLTIENLKGKAAYSLDGYVMDDDGFSRPIMFCYEGDQGHFDNNRVDFSASDPTLGYGLTPWTKRRWLRSGPLISRIGGYCCSDQGCRALFPASVGAFVEHNKV